MRQEEIKALYCMFYRLDSNATCSAAETLAIHTRKKWNPVHPSLSFPSEWTEFVEEPVAEWSPPVMCCECGFEIVGEYLCRETGEAFHPHHVHCFMCEASPSPSALQPPHEQQQQQQQLHEDGVARPALDLHCYQGRLLCTSHFTSLIPDVCPGCERGDSQHSAAQGT
jgi:hypothetical protein